MPVFKRDRDKQQQNNKAEQIASVMRTRVFKQAGLAAAAILVTIVLLFAMSTAWYSNVLEAGSLTFQAEKWEVNAKDLSTGEKISIQPGARGILPVSYRNSSGSVINASVAVSKSGLERELQKRVYFYTETPYTVASGERKETVARRYLTNGTAAPYTVLGMGQLTMSDAFCTVDAPIYWEWVYDLLGYYVKVDTQYAEDGSVTELEYLRPVVYDYDKATFDADGSLATVDGQHVDLFLQELTASDGYLNTFTETNYATDKNNGAKYYIVENDNAEALGYYTAIRLYTRQEIQAANAWDTQKGSSVADFTGLQITVTGEAANIEVTRVNTAEELKTALTDEKGGYIQLAGDLELTEAVSITTAQPVTLDLGGSTLTGSTTAANLFTVGKGASLTVFNGTVKSSTVGSALFGVTNGRLTVSGVTGIAEGNNQFGINIRDNGSKPEDGDSVVLITHSTLETTYPAVMVVGNHTTTAQKTRCIIENSTLKSGFAGIYGNGQSQMGGTEVEIKDSIISGTYTAVYHPQDNSVLKAENTTFTGNTGIVVKGGSVYLNDCTVSGTGKIGAPEFAASGFADTGAAIYLEAGYDRDSILIAVTGENTKVTAAEQKSVLLYTKPQDSKTRKAAIMITAGTFSGDVTDYLANALFECKEATDENNNKVWVVGPRGQSQSAN